MDIDLTDIVDRLRKLEEDFKELNRLWLNGSEERRGIVNWDHIRDLQKELLKQTTIKVFQEDGKSKPVPLVTVFEDFLKSYAVKPVEVKTHFEFREDGGGL